MKDLWHFPRAGLAQQIISMFDIGISSALVFFAPRRMGKTEFLCKDILPQAQKKDWSVFYFSFLDAEDSIENIFISRLVKFAESIGAIKNKSFPKIKKIGGEIIGIRTEIELGQNEPVHYTLLEIISILSKKHKILLLLDEVQTLATHKKNNKFVAQLRTAFDLNKDQVKVIFTGSSREGLRQMFSQISAPFFHFGQNLPFPEFGQEFTDHLCAIFNKVTKRKLDRIILWEMFVGMDKIPQLARSLVERLVLNPNKTIQEIKDELLAEVYNDRAYAESWVKNSKLEQLILHEIANNIPNLFSDETRHLLAKKLGIDQLNVSTIQSCLRSLQRKNLIGKKDGRAGYYVEDPNFNTWIKSFVF